MTSQACGIENQRIYENAIVYGDIALYGTPVEDVDEINVRLRDAAREWDNTEALRVYENNRVNQFEGVEIRSAGSVVELPEREPIIDCMVRRRQVMNIVSVAKAGKSFFVEQLGVCVAAGVPFLGFETRQADTPSKVLFLDYENDSVNFNNRLYKIAQELCVPMENVASLHYASFEGNGIDVFQMEKFLADAGAKYDLVVVDCLKEAKPSFYDENSNDAMNAVYARIKNIAKNCDAAVVVVHHTSKGMGRNQYVMDAGRGASAIGGAAGSQIVIRPDGDYDEDAPESEIIYRIDFKCRSFKTPPPTRIQFKYPLWESINQGKNGLSAYDKKLLRWWKCVLPRDTNVKLKKKDIILNAMEHGLQHGNNFVDRAIEYAHRKPWITYIESAAQGRAKEYFWVPGGWFALNELDGVYDAPAAEIAVENTEEMNHTTKLVRTNHKKPMSK